MRPNWHLFLLAFAFKFFEVDGNACNSICYNDQHPKCHVKLEDNNIKNLSGIYQIFDGNINFYCIFESLPTPVEVSWKYRSRSENKHYAIPCARTSNTQNCSKNDANRIQAECTLRLNYLDLTGTYFCEGLQSNGMLVSSPQAEIEVIGIELAEVAATKLHLDSEGFVEIRICANPKPEIFWLLPNARFLKTTQSYGKYSSGELLPILHKRPMQSSDLPLHFKPYCYSNRLVIGKVDSGDAKIDFIVRNAGETRQLGLNLLTRPPINLARTKHLMNGRILFLSFLFLYKMFLWI